MAEIESTEKFKAVQELMHEMIAMWQRVKDLEAADRDQRQEIDSLRVSDSRSRCVAEKLPLRFFFKDTLLNYILCSEAYALDWEMKPAELSGKSDRDLFSAEVVDKLADIEHEVIRSGRMEIAEEDRLVAGREITVLAIRKPIINGTGESLGLLGVLWDITEDKKQKASQQNRIHELEGALSEWVGKVDSLGNEMEKSSAEYRRKEEEFGRLRAELEAELQARREEIHRLKNELQKEIFERGQAVEALKRSVAHSQELLDSVQKAAGAAR